MSQHLVLRPDRVEIAVTDRGSEGPAVILLHGLAGNSRELLRTADAISDSFHVLLVDQRGHGSSTRRPSELSRKAFVDDVIAVIEQLLPRQTVSLVGQSMGAHTAFLTAAARPDLIDRIVMLEGHVAGSNRPEEAAEIGAYFASWPVFSNADHARSFLGSSPLTEAWIRDLEATPDGLRPRFDAAVMEQISAAVNHDRWAEWEQLVVPTLAIFAEHGMFTADQKDELFRRNPRAERADIVGASHDAHLDGFDVWAELLKDYLAGIAKRPRTP